MSRVKLGVIFGGASEEHPVSVKSAGEVARSLDTAKYEIVWIGITTAGEWKLCADPGPGWEGADGRSVTLSPDRGLHGLLVQGVDGYEPIRLDVVFPMLHGKLGEDGAIQGLLELAGTNKNDS